MRFGAEDRAARVCALFAVVAVGATVCAGASTRAGAVAIPALVAGLSVSPGGRPGTYALNWATSAPPVGFVFDVQMRDAARPTWTTLVSGTTARGRAFTPSVAGPYSLRSRLRNAKNGHTSRWSPTVTLAGNWSMFQADQQHTGVRNDVAIGASTAARLRVKWKALVAPNSGVLASPAVAFNAHLRKPIVYSATNDGTITATDLATGKRVWASAGNGPILSSPAVAGNTVYVGTEGHNVFAFDATTGTLQCSFSLGGAVISSPVVGTVDGTGPVVFFGDDGAGVPGSPGHEWAVNGVGNTAGACTRKWDFEGWNNPGPMDKRTGTWSSPALTTDSTGRPLLVFGSNDPDDSLYALDARTGTPVWHFRTKTTAADQDVGAAPMISRPGLNGFAHGVVYAAGKDNIVYALDLLTGRQIWAVNLQRRSGGISGTPQSAAALIGNQIVVPYARYVFSLNATTGTQTWRSAAATGNYFSSPAVSGASGNKTIVIGDDTGVEHAYRLRDGASILQLNAAGAVYSSAAIAYGSVLFATTSGYLYALG